MDRIYHPYMIWEDYLSGMWRILPKSEEPLWLQIAIEFTGNTELYGQWMRRVILEWPLSCQHNLSNESMNRWAWIGHAACCLATGCPEYITRSAWGILSDEQRDTANAQAEGALQSWLSTNESLKSLIPAPPSFNLRQLGYAGKINGWIEKWESKGYPFGIPDEAPSNLEEMGRVPSYRMACLAIMRNDSALVSLGFSRPPCEAYNVIKRQELAIRGRE